MIDADSSGDGDRNDDSESESESKSDLDVEGAAVFGALAAQDAAIQHMAASL